MIGNLIQNFLLPSQQDTSHGESEDFNVVGGEIFATFSPWASWLYDHNGAVADAGSDSTTSIDPGSGVAVSSGGITFNLLYDAAALAAPASFRAGIQQAVSILAAAISDKITVNIKIDYSGTGRGAAAGPDHGLFQSYSSTRTNLINNASPGDTTFNALAAGSSIQGQSSVAVWNAQLKLWGLIGANDTTTDDGAAFFSTDIDPNLLVGVALHELTHAMGRIPYGPQPDIFDFFRFTSPGTRLFQGGATAPAAYFSLDGGNTKLGDYGRTSDASDFLNSGVQGANDPFNEFYNAGTSQQLTAADLKQLNALGFHLTAAGPGSITISDASVTEGNSGTKVETFTVTRSGGTAAFDVNFATANGTATTADSDYVAKSGTLHFGTGVNTQPITIIINGDTKIEANEAFSVNLSAATNGATISDGLGMGTILNDDGTSPSPDFNADLHGDLLFRTGNGSVPIWQMNGTQVGFADYTKLGSSTVGAPDLSWHIMDTGDFDGDHRSDVLWQTDGGGVAIWEMSGIQIKAADYTRLGSSIVGAPGRDWHIIGSGDFDGDGNSDLLWKTDGGGVAIWEMNGTQIKAADYTKLGSSVVGAPGGDWHIIGSGDFDGDGKADLLWRTDGGQLAIWEMNGTQIKAADYLRIGSQAVGAPDASWHFVTTGDFDNDGRSDLLWRTDSGQVAIWEMNDTQIKAADYTRAGSSIVGSPDPLWQLAGAADVDGNGTSDLLWQTGGGNVAIWEMNGMQISAADTVKVGGSLAGTGLDWTIVQHHYDVL